MSEYGSGSEDPDDQDYADGDLTNVLEDPNLADEFIGSLVTSDGLVSSWTRLTARMDQLEKKTREVAKRLAAVFSTFVTREEYQAQVVDKHGSQIEELYERLQKVEGSCLKLEDTVFDKHASQLGNVLRRVGTVEGFSEETKAELKTLEERSSERYDKAVEKQTSACKGLQGLVEQLRRDHEGLRLSHGDTVERAQQLRADLQKLDDFVMGDDLFHLVEKHVDERLMDYINNERMETERQKIMGMVDETYNKPLLVHLDDVNEVIEEHRQIVDKKDFALHRIVSSIEHSIAAQREELLRTKAGIMDEVEVRARVSEVEDVENRLANSVTEARAETSQLQNKCVSKLNAFADHFAKIHINLKDHEHCLTHHAEELENRATKYSLLACQNRMESLVPLERFENEFEEVKRVLDWQSHQLDGISMSGAGGNSKKKEGRKTTGGPKEGGRMIVANSASPDQATPAAGHRDSQTYHEVDDDEEEPTLYVLQNQLEFLAMGVVALAHIELRQPELGGSRQFRLENGKDLIEHLQSVRHWITHRNAPGDWNPDGLRSVALRCAHPKPQELVGPLPTAPSMAAVAAAAAHLPSRKGGETEGKGMKRIVSAPLQTMTAILGPSASTKSLSARSLPSQTRKEPSQNYFAMPAAPAPRQARHSLARPQKAEKAENISDHVFTCTGMRPEMWEDD